MANGAMKATASEKPNGPINKAIKGSLGGNLTRKFERKNIDFKPEYIAPKGAKVEAGKNSHEQL